MAGQFLGLVPSPISAVIMQSDQRQIPSAHHRRSISMHTRSPVEREWFLEECKQIKYMFQFFINIPWDKPDLA
jgi:hypothetical protein